MLQAILMMLVAFAKSDIHWSPSKVLTILLMIVGGTVVFSCLFLLYAAFSFFTLEGLEFMNVLTDGGKEFGQYPLAVYGKAVLTFCTVAVPYAWFQQIPLDYLTGHSENILRMFAPLVCFVFLLPVMQSGDLVCGTTGQPAPKRPYTNIKAKCERESRPAFCFSVDRFYRIKYYKLYKYTFITKEMS